MKQHGVQVTSAITKRVSLYTVNEINRTASVGARYCLPHTHSLTPHVPSNLVYLLAAAAVVVVVVVRSTDHKPVRGDDKRRVGGGHGGGRLHTGDNCGAAPRKRSREAPPPLAVVALSDTDNASDAAWTFASPSVDQQRSRVPPDRPLVDDPTTW